MYKVKTLWLEINTATDEYNVTCRDFKWSSILPHTDSKVFIFYNNTWRLEMNNSLHSSSHPEGSLKWFTENFWELGV